MVKNRTMHKLYCGVIVPLVTPLNEDGELDEQAVRRILDHVIAAGVQGVFILGTTGEGPSTPREMRARMVQLVLEYVAGRAQVYVGVYDNVISAMLDSSRDYLRKGATAVVAQLPGYYRLPPDDQFRFLSTMVKSIPGPFLLYDIPAVVHMSIDPGVIEHLRAFSNLVGIIDTSGNRERLLGLLDSYADDEGFSVLVGSTAQAAHGFEYGADGFVPSAGNLNPSLCVRLYQAAQKGDSILMASLQQEINGLQAQYAADGYIGLTISRLKKRMADEGLCGPGVLPPLQEQD